MKLAVNQQIICDEVVWWQIVTQRDSHEPWVTWRVTSAWHLGPELAWAHICSRLWPAPLTHTWTGKQAKNEENWENQFWILATINWSSIFFKIVKMRRVVIEPVTRYQCKSFPDVLTSGRLYLLTLRISVRPDPVSLPPDWIMPPIAALSLASHDWVRVEVNHLLRSETCHKWHWVYCGLHLAQTRHDVIIVPGGWGVDQWPWWHTPWPIVPDRYTSDRLRGIICMGRQF